ncbi:hypothetical protein [Actinoplanes couchii]|uniref:hypothetical protein n=1 Tax=Actinoplanes couchii TaxID=403638 RepID=UPI00194422C6|nr:hypothetical protein [Actinoplanes couchii]MDR6321917.1 membrane protein implicated in regulation of membrane protease activity [Actinoplanes couchii]
MLTATVVFLVIGGVAVVLLALALLGGELLHFGHPDASGPLSTEVAAGFLGAFGFVGAAASELLDARTAAVISIAVAIGALAAFPAAWLAWRLARAVRNMRTDATPQRANLVGSLGTVVTSVPAGSGYGEVTLRLGGQPVKVYARADRAIPTGAQVFVIEAPSDTSVVVEQTP